MRSDHGPATARIRACAAAANPLSRPTPAVGWRLGNSLFCNHLFLLLPSDMALAAAEVLARCCLFLFLVLWFATPKRMYITVCVNAFWHQSAVAVGSHPLCFSLAFLDGWDGF